MYVQPVQTIYRPHTRPTSPLLRGCLSCMQEDPRRTPLTRAVYRGHVPAVRALLGAGANVLDPVNYWKVAGP